MSTIKIKLEGNAKTLLISLVCRALCTLQPDTPFQDEMALKLVKKIDIDVSKIADEIIACKLFCLSRAYHFDAVIKTFLVYHPNGVIVDLGAGLDTGFYRTDNRKVTWFDVDLPDVILLKQKLITIPNRVRYILKDVRDFSWIELINSILDRKKINKKILFTAGGLFQYLDEAEVKKIIIALAGLFPGCELIFDCPPKDILSHANRAFKLTESLSDIEYKFGINNGTELADWSPNIIIKRVAPYFEKLTAECKLSIPVLGMIDYYNLINKSKIIHLAFKEKQHAA